MTPDLIKFLDQHKGSLQQHCHTEFNPLFGSATHEWVDWLLEGFYLSLVGKQSARCKFADKGWSMAESVLVLDKMAFVLRNFIFDQTDLADHFGEWSQAIDLSLIKMRQRCLKAIQPRAAPAMFSDVQLVRILNQISQDMLQEHTEHAIFDVISKGLSRFGLHIAVFKISPDLTRGELHFSTYSSEVNQDFIQSVGVEKSDFYQFEIPSSSRLSEAIRSQAALAFFPNDELLACLLNTEDQATIRYFQHSMGSTQTILASGRVNNQLQAVLAVSGDQLTEQEIPTISIFANQLAIAIQNAALYHAADQRAEQLAGLNALPPNTALRMCLPRPPPF
jgi:hypothetical protein